ncbi:uracil-DNA glycosylase [Uliginosibacterium sp. H3]|uniref:Type-4 uracil-DNA glycosylase n=1 Tax=Uliginosibacterium silvisoli TaxID=3114758 RepID=A0ABU6K9Q6_9RHOO|nr:uracil-DNA glycosylase [Uliginosibacterium sp. H3]
MSVDKTRVLAEMGIKPLWRLREPLAQPARAEESIALAPEPMRERAPDPIPAMQPELAQIVRQLATQSVLETETSGVSALGWEELSSTVADCRACGLCKARKQAVFGVGDRQADWMFVGEGPGAEEDERGEPFVGQAGKLLDAMLEASGLKRGEKVYIANAVKCRPPGNRTPEADEIAACRPYLDRQIELVKPKLLIALGRPAAQALLGREMSIASARGKLHQYAHAGGAIPVVVTYHPAYLLRNLPDKAKAWVDMCFAADTIAQSRD